MNILFVCTGNTCRSPMAEGYLKSKNISASSCGLYADSSPVSKNSQTVMAEIGIDISNHISRQITIESIEKADKIICMSQSHADALKNICGDKLSVLGDGISDPYGMDLDTYRNCRDQIIYELDMLFSVEVEIANQQHIKDITKIEKECFSQPWSENAIGDAMAHGTKFFIAQQNGKILGYLGISVILDEGYITNIAVKSQHRKKGIATKLLNRLFDFAIDNDISFISLEVRESNSNAISLYKKFGFKDEGIRKNFYENPKENAIIMTKRF